MGLRDQRVDRGESQQLKLGIVAAQLTQVVSGDVVADNKLRPFAQPVQLLEHRCAGSCCSRAVCVAVVEAQPGDRFDVVSGGLDVDRYAALKPCAADMLERLVSGASLHLVVRRAPVSRRSASVLSALSHYGALSLRLPALASVL